MCRPCQHSGKATIHSSHFHQLFPYMMLAYVYNIILTIGCVGELCFNIPLTLKLYGDGAIGLKWPEAGGEGVEPGRGRTCELQFGKLLRYMYC